MAVRKIIQSSISGGNSKENDFLHMRSNNVDFFDERLHNIIKDLRDTLWAYPVCVGLSAPQISEPYRISVINPFRQSREDDIILINPQIIKESGKKDKKRESCMSVWGYMGEVERRHKLEIEYQDINQNIIRKVFEGFEARVVHHEIDHLDGILYSDITVPNTILTHANFFDELNILDNEE